MQGWRTSGCRIIKFPKNSNEGDRPCVRIVPCALIGIDITDAGAKGTRHRINIYKAPSRARCRRSGCLVSSGKNPRIPGWLVYPIFERVITSGSALNTAYEKKWFAPNFSRSLNGKANLYSWPWSLDFPGSLEAVSGWRHDKRSKVAVRQIVSNGSDESSESPTSMGTSVRSFQISQTHIGPE